MVDAVYLCHYSIVPVTLPHLSFRLATALSCGQAIYAGGGVGKPILQTGTEGSKSRNTSYDDQGDDYGVLDGGGAIFGCNKTFHCI